MLFLNLNKFEDTKKTAYLFKEFLNHSSIHVLDKFKMASTDNS
jgi:hypothetical protein